MDNEKSKDMIKLGEYVAVDIIGLFELLSNMFPDFEFVIAAGRSYDWYSLYSSCKRDNVRDAVDEYLRAHKKSIKIKINDNSLTKSPPITLEK
ncbi:MAG: hypothetical protein ACXAEX_15265 [Promethearchaeota archaeon]|jgi:hypothetical protein